MPYFNVDSQLSSVESSSLPLIPYGIYRIRSKNSNIYLDCTSNGLVTMQQSNHGASQEWTISPAADGDYEIWPIRSQVGVLRVNNQNHLICGAGGQTRSFTWNIDPRGRDAYMIGDATNALVIQLPINGPGPVIVDVRKNETCQHWSIEPLAASTSGEGSSDGSDGNATGNTALQVQVRNTPSPGVFAVPGFTWNVQPNLRSIADLPIGTQMMACEPGNSDYRPIQADFEALQIARWALDCFVSVVPITHPGGRGNYDSVPASLEAGWVNSLGEGWVGRYVFQRLLDIASLHHATRAVPITHPSGTPGEVPSALQNATSSWDDANRKLFSFCFRLHQALVQAGAIVPVTGSLSGTMATLPTATNATGFPTGTYFEIRARGSNNVLKTCHFSNDDGAQIQLWPRPSGGRELRAAAFFLDRTGALCHGSGLNVDVVDNCPIVRQRRPVMNPPNHWSHPFPRFSYENSQIRIRLYSDPALPSCSEYLYPNESWRNSEFVLVRNSQQNIHMHPLSDFQPWALRVPFTPPVHFSTNHNNDIRWRIVVEPISENAADDTLWDIIPLRS